MLLQNQKYKKLLWFVFGASLFLLNLAGKEFGRFNNPMPALYTSGTVFTVFGANVT